MEKKWMAEDMCITVVPQDIIRNRGETDRRKRNVAPLDSPLTGCCLKPITTQCPFLFTPWMMPRMFFSGSSNRDRMIPFGGVFGLLRSSSPFFSLRVTLETKSRRL
jgi:hypothetical protein